MTTKAPTYWQLVAIRKLWPDTPVKTIAKRVSIGYSTLRRWRDEGLLGDLPERNVPAGGVPGKSRRLPRPPKVTTAPLQVEPLCTTRECERCQFELVCLERVRAGGWVLCETPAEDHVRMMMELLP